MSDTYWVVRHPETKELYKARRTKVALFEDTKWDRNQVRAAARRLQAVGHAAEAVCVRLTEVEL